MYTVISNPLLPSESKSSPPSSLSQRIVYKWNGSRIRQAINSTKRVVPSNFDQTHSKPSSTMTFGSIKPTTLPSKGSSASLRHKTATDHQGPDVYYDGLIDTLDQFPRDRLDWLFQPSPVEEQLSQWKDPRSIVLRKPHRSKLSGVSKSSNFPMAMLYLRVLDVVKPSSAKACSFYCQVQIQDQVYTGKPTSCVKYEKQSSQADIDEVFLLDMNQAEKVTFRLYMRTQSSLLKGGRKRSAEVCLGQYTQHWNLRPMKKQVNRMTFYHGEDIYQVMMVHGMFMTERAQSLISNQALHADYLTIYLRGRTIPRWQRYWGVLHATFLVLYDFEYKKSKPPKQVISFHTLEHVFHPSHEEEEQMIDVGRLGLALQFASSEYENRMYMLPDNDHSGHEWEASLEYCASLVNEFRSSKINNEPIPTKFLW